MCSDLLRSVLGLGFSKLARHSAKKIQVESKFSPRTVLGLCLDSVRNMWRSVGTSKHLPNVTASHTASP